MRAIYCLLLFIIFNFPLQAQNHSIAHEWSENLLEAIRNDFARPTVHARNLYHCSIAMYDIWSLYDTTGLSNQVLAGNTLNGINCPINDFPTDGNIQLLREEAMSYAMYRIMRQRFVNSPGRTSIYVMIEGFMQGYGYDTSFESTDYESGNPAALGNYIAECILNYGLNDNANEQNGYTNQFYEATNPPMVIEFEGNTSIVDYNKWQPLTLDVFIDQAGNEIPFNTPEFLSPEWGSVFPFALQEEDLTIYDKDGDEYWVYHDPGPPPLIDVENGGGMSSEYKWGFSLVSKWSAHLDKNDPTLIDISPASIGNITSYPQNITELREFYKDVEGGDTSQGRTENPKTGMPYEEQWILRGDYGRILAEFWADGPDSETPPGHWVAILNEIKDHPEYDKRYNGKGEVLEELEYDVKAYLTLSGAMHDAAIAAWGAKGYYDYIRPVSAIRAMADLGQSTSPTLPHYHPGGFELEEGLIELVNAGDPLAGISGEHIGKIKLFAWRGPDYIGNPNTSEAGVGWILAENWWPYQRPSFVTPPFAGYVSGHSTFSRAAAEVLTLLTNDEYFPGGVGIFEAKANEFLVFEDGPSQDIQLQWATYRDASDQCSLSRIWGGIHPPADDMPGRLMGIEIGVDAFHHAKQYFYNDEDGDGYFTFEDCDDTNPMINPGMSENCDDIDNNCNTLIDEGLDLIQYFLDADGDGFGDAENFVEICNTIAPSGYVADATDCNDNEPLSNPAFTEVCDGVDNDCDGIIDNGLQIFTYYLDKDSDGFGDSAISLDTCQSFAVTGYVANADDCNDNDASIHPNSPEICDAIDNDCNGLADDGLTKNRYYLDLDEDGFGDSSFPRDTCIDVPPVGFCGNALDCNDNDALINPNSPEICDAIDNDCNGLADDGLPKNRYYLDLDEDGFGDSSFPRDTCIDVPPTGFCGNALDCNDNDASIHPDSPEVCDAVDNNCNGLADEGLLKNRYYLDLDQDGFGDINFPADTCIDVPPLNYVVDDSDCNDSNSNIYPGASEISDNGIDEDCSGLDYFKITKVFPNPVRDIASIHYEIEGEVNIIINNAAGKTVVDKVVLFASNVAQIDLSNLTKGVYIMRLEQDRNLTTQKIIKH